MKYYFNSLEQIKGDEAYNEEDFEQALVHYKKALSLLNQTASQRNFKPMQSFYDALAYVLSEIIITKTDLIRASLNSPLNYSHTEDLWMEIPSLVNEIRAVSEQIHSYEHKETKIEKINLTYKAIANCSEAISDALIDSVDGEKNTDLVFEHVVSSLRWLKQAINYYQNAILPITIETHIGYLNLLERAYKCHQDKQFLNQITAYIQENNLLEYELVPEEELEILSYQLLVATEQKDEARAIQYTQRCKVLMENSDQVDLESLIIEDINRLISKLPNSTQEIIPSKTKFRRPLRIILEESDEEYESIGMEASTSLTGDNISLAKTPHTPDPTSFEIDFEEVQPSTMDQQSSTQISSAPLFAFFASSSTTDQSVLSPVNHADVFVKIMQEVANHYRDRNFLANLLSLIGDFYYGSPALVSRNSVLMTVEIYEAVLRLDSQHTVAHFRLQEIYNRNKATRGTINDYRRYAGTIKCPISTGFIDIFNDAIEENLIQVETFLSTNSKKIEDVVNRLLQFITNALVEKNIAGSKSQFIAQELLTRYQELIHSQEPIKAMFL